MVKSGVLSKTTICIKERFKGGFKRQVQTWGSRQNHHLYQGKVQRRVQKKGSKAGF